MPTVLRRAGFVIKIFHAPREHGPAHVHVFRSGAEIVVELAPLAIRNVLRMRPAEIIAAVALVEDNRDVLLDAWRTIHG